MPRTQMTTALSGIELLIARVNCGGRNVTLAKESAGEIRSYLTRRFIALKRPYARYAPCQRNS